MKKFGFKPEKVWYMTDRQSDQTEIALLQANRAEAMRRKRARKRRMMQRRKRKLFHRRLALAAVFLAVLVLGILLAVNHNTITVQLRGAPEISMELGDTFADPGAAASLRGTIFHRAGFALHVGVSGKVDTQTEGTYRLDYTARWFWHKETAQRVVHVVNQKEPKLVLSGGSEQTLTQGSRFVDPGYTAEDLRDGDLTDKVTVSGSVDDFTPGTYRLKYTVSDSDGNTVSAERTVTVVPAKKVIYLTFDDGPGEHTERLLDILEQAHAHATFFLVDTGCYAPIQRMAREGHSVGIHSASHRYDRIYASEEAYFRDLNAMKDIIRVQTGVETTLLRFPGGSSKMVSSFNPGIMSRLTKAVTEQGYQYFDWNVDSDDAGSARGAEQVYQNVVDGVSQRDVSVVLMHDIYGSSVDAAERIIAWGQENGYVFLGLSSASPECHHGVNN